MDATLRLLTVVYGCLWARNIEGSVPLMLGSTTRYPFTDPFGEMKAIDGRQYMRHVLRSLSQAKAKHKPSAKALKARGGIRGHDPRHRQPNYLKPFPHHNAHISKSSRLYSLYMYVAP